MFKLIDYRVLKFDIEKSNFINCLKSNINKDRSFLLDFFDFSDKQYFGEIYADNFNIRRKKTFFSTKYHCKTYGQITGKNNETTIALTTRGYDWYVYTILILILLLIIFIHLVVIKSQQYEYLIITLTFSFFLIGIPILILRKRLKKYTFELEKDLFYITKQQNVLQHRINNC